jgi:hypothetical protein
VDLAGLRIKSHLSCDAEVRHGDEDAFIDVISSCIPLTAGLLLKQD